ncbi:Methyltransferase domain-containing protein [Sanguibacter gelidistatuariae]|uniref:Methyltransferase domain-containing protein n=1 Tax=Sanguibacter gelidistatuariae TaxID=1814289 RepID=A0A1G6HRT6_9MICO|nr:class I SAM-dependent methyltransferase [Sanguibacter gelidistatuariae]SDB96942.1 Methyltransferase domain-containing protein [Sanguibacter gelidistatuariae]
MDIDRDGVRRAPDGGYAHLTSPEIRVETHRLFSRRDDDVEAAVLGALALTGTETVLDVGSGTGTFVQNLIDRGHTGRVIALDLSFSAYLTARAVPGVEAIHASADEIPLPDGSVDVVLSRQMLVHCPSPEMIVAECARVLTADGVFVATVNHARTVPMIRHVIETELGSLGLRVPDSASWVTTDTVAELVGRFFETVDVVRHDNELVFTGPGPLVRYATSLFSLYGVDDDPATNQLLVDRVTARVEDWFRATSEPWLEPKGYSVCSARGLLPV